MRINGNPDNVIGVNLYSVDESATTFFEEEGYLLKPAKRNDAFEWAGRMKEGRFWELVNKSYTEGLAVMLLRRALPASDAQGNLPLHCLLLDSNKWQFDEALRAKFKDEKT